MFVQILLRSVSERHAAVTGLDLREKKKRLADFPFFDEYLSTGSLSPAELALLLLLP